MIAHATDARHTQALIHPRRAIEIERSVKRARQLITENLVFKPLTRGVQDNHASAEPAERPEPHRLEHRASDHVNAADLNRIPVFFFNFFFDICEALTQTLCNYGFQ